MGTTPTLADGEEFVAGRSREKAAELVALAEKAGLKGSIRTTYNGYIFPSAIYAQGAADATADADTPADEQVDDNPKGTEYDPSAATVDEVRDYLANANEEERARVLEAEAASAKPRKGILDLATTPEGAK